MKKILVTYLLAVFAFGSCQKPEEFITVRDGDALVSFTASFPYDDSDDNSFKAEIDNVNHVINVVIPYNYPIGSDNVITSDVLSGMRVQALTENNVVIEPALLFMDLDKENKITIFDNLEGTKTVYSVKSEIRKSAECRIKSFSLTDLGLSGVINDDNTISIVTPDIIGNALADISLSHGASISPDPRVTAIDFDQDQTFTVTAQNGVDKLVYVVKKSVPAKISSGIRPGSGVLLWTKKIAGITGISNPQKVHGIAISGNEIIINEQGSLNLVKLSTVDGSDKGIMSLPGTFTNNFLCSDDAGHLLFCNTTRTDGDGDTFFVYSADSPSSPLSKLIQYKVGAKTVLGWKISVQGDISKDAAISSCFIKDGVAKIAVWYISDGTVTSQTPTIISTTLETSNYGRWSDCVVGGTAPGSDYFLASYAKSNDSNRYVLWYKGADNSVRSKLKLWNNSVLDIVDFEEFNGNPMMVYGNVNTFTWGVSDTDWLKIHDISTGVIDNPMEVIPAKKYGAQPAGSSNGEGYGDALMVTSKNGFYLNVYFYFAGGYVGCVQYDCFDK